MHAFAPGNPPWKLVLKTRQIQATLQPLVLHAPILILSFLLRMGANAALIHPRYAITTKPVGKFGRILSLVTGFFFLTIK
jgi:hypothetical protein